MKKIIYSVAFALVFASCSASTFELPRCWGKTGVKKAYCKTEKAIDNLKEKIQDRKEALVD